MRTTPAASEAAPLKAFEQMAVNQAKLLYEGNQKANMLQTGSCVEANCPHHDIISVDSLEAFREVYTGTIGDMMSCGIASMLTGLPLWLLGQDTALIPQDFKAVTFQEQVPTLMKVG